MKSDLVFSDNCLRLVLMRYTIRVQRATSSGSRGFFVSIAIYHHVISNKITLFNLTLCDLPPISSSKARTVALTSVTQVVELCPAKPKVTSWVPSQSASLGCRPSPV